MSSLIELPPPPALERIARGLATLDAMLSEEWDYRYFSFDARWGEGERMASMRNGCGDDWFIVFTDTHVFVKGLAHEYPTVPVDDIFAGAPSALARQLAEPAFSMDRVSYGGWWDGTAWTLRCAPGVEARMSEDLKLLRGNPADYAEHATDYFEIDVPVAVAEHVIAARPLTDAFVVAISNRNLAGMQTDLDQIGYLAPTGLPS